MGKPKTDLSTCIMVDTADLMTLTMMAASVGAARSTLSNWRERFEDFPKPIISVGHVELFSWEQYVEFLTAHGYEVVE
jgi:hypothetical protein